MATPLGKMYEVLVNKRTCLIMPNFTLISYSQGWPQCYFAISISGYIIQMENFARFKVPDFCDLAKFTNVLLRKQG